MYKVKKNDEALLQLKLLAEKANLDIKSLILSEEHIDDVCSIFYSHLPKLVKMAMNKDKFKIFYSSHKEQFANSISI